MRRIALTFLLLVAAVGGAVVTTAGADDTHTYTIELDNAFGIVEGSEVRVAGVKQGQVTSLDINAEKRALVTVELSGPLSTLGQDTECSSEPQSLIAEYFLDCQPQGDPIPAEEEGSTDDPNIPVEQTTQTVQADLVQNTLREPFKRRFQLIINEFGTALAGNPENLNAAIRRGAPALRELEGVLDILGDFLAELQPTLADTETLARAQTPVLADLRASAPGLNTLARNLPDFNESSRLSLNSLGEAAVVGKRALENGD